MPVPGAAATPLPVGPGNKIVRIRVIRRRFTGVVSKDSSQPELPRNLKLACDSKAALKVAEFAKLYFRVSGRRLPLAVAVSDAKLIFAAPSGY